MNILEKLTDNTILICSSISKEKILNELYETKKITNFKIMNLNEFIKKMTFDYDTKTINYLMKKYNLLYENALVYLKNLYCILEDNYENEKLLNLLNMKNDLINNDLLIFDDLFKQNIKTKKIIFYDIDTDYKYIDKLLKDAKYEIVTSDTKQSKKTIHLFETIEEEINFVANKICSLVSDGIDINNIKLTNVTSEYTFLIKNIFGFYGLKIEDNNETLYGTLIGKYFLDNIKENTGDTIDELKEKYTDEEANENINIIINICNKYVWCDNYLDIKDMLEYELKNTKKFRKKYDNTIKIVDINDIDNDDNNYIFLLGFNQESIPKIYKDDEYLTDEIKKKINLEISSDKNQRTIDRLKRLILSLDKLTITCKKKTNFNKFYLSNLNDELHFEIKEETIDFTKSYGPLNLKINLCKQLDEFVKYNVKADSLSLLFSNFEDIPYKKYDNNYSGIDKEDLLNYLNNKLYLSYTSVDNFYECKFKFYISNILKLDPFEENFSAFIGSLTHDILEKYFKYNIDCEKEFDDYVAHSNYDFSFKDRFFLNKIKEELKQIMEIISKQKSLTNFNYELYEKQLEIEKDNKIKIIFKGKIDKIMYLEKDNKTYFSIVDYKTGNISFDLRYIKDGLNLQLPIYAYLVMHNNVFKNPVISGLYYQRLFHDEIKTTTLEDYNKQKYDNLKLIGASTSDEDILKEFDSTYQNSDLIKSMKMTKDGFSKSSKIYSNKEFENILNVTENKIDEAIEDILNGDFKINPKQIDKENISCKYCKYKDLCYMQESNKEIIEVGD